MLYIKKNHNKNFILSTYFIFLRFKFLFVSSFIYSDFKLTLGLVIISLCLSCDICDS